jgi:hypothetical protein
MRSASKYLGVAAAVLLALGLTVVQLRAGAGTTDQTRAVDGVSPAGPNPNDKASPQTAPELFGPALSLPNVGSLTAGSNNGVSQRNHATRNAAWNQQATLLRVDQRQPTTTGNCGCKYHPGDPGKKPTHHPGDPGKKPTQHRRHHQDDDNQGHKHKRHHKDDDDKGNKHKRHHKDNDDSSDHGQSVRSSGGHGSNGVVSQSQSASNAGGVRQGANDNPSVHSSNSSGSSPAVEPCQSALAGCSG